MKPKPKIVIGTPDPEALKDPGVAKLWSDEFEEKLLAGMRQAKETALRKQQTAGQRRTAAR